MGGLSLIEGFSARVPRRICWADLSLSLLMQMRAQACPAPRGNGRAPAEWATARTSSRPINIFLIWSSDLRVEARNRRSAIFLS